jgi:hypothetical protein
VRHWPEAAVSTAAQLALAGVFLWSSLSKLVPGAALTGTIRRLGAGPRLAAVIGWAVAGAELAVGVALAVCPRWAWPRAGVVVLAVAFAAAGASAAVRGLRIACRCFGDVGSRRLGWRQVWLLPVWLGLGALAQWRPAGWSVPSGLTVLAALLFGLIALRLPAVFGPMRKLREDRIAMAPTYAGIIGRKPWELTA